MPNLLLPDVLSYLGSEFPTGAVFDPSGGLAAKGKEAPKPARKLGSLEELVKMAQASKPLQFELGGEAVEVLIRGLSAQETDVIEKQLPQPVPPRKPAAKSGETVPDYENEEYVAACEATFSKKRAAIISHGLVDLQVPGDSVEQQATYLQANFTPGILDKLLAAIRGLTSNDFSRTNF